MPQDPATPDADTEDRGRARAIRHTTFVAIATNSALVVGQVTIGLLANAWSLVADAIHTLSDLITDFMVLIAGQRGAVPADRKHPYGHARIETLVSLALGVVLALIGCGFLWAGGQRLNALDELPALTPPALYMALFTLLAKEALFRYTLAAGRRLRSRLLVANAWHARSDAASSLVVAIGIGGSLAGYRFLEPLAAALVGFLILHMGLRFVREAIDELIDSAIPDEELQRIRLTLKNTPGVRGVHELRTRRMANRILCDAHLQVAPRLSVSEGHRIAERARLNVCEAHPDVLDVLVHVDAENDHRSDPDTLNALPDRNRLLAELHRLLGDTVPPPERVQLHYLGNQVEIDVLMPAGWQPDLAAQDALKQRIDARLAADQTLRQVVIFTRSAP